MKQTRIHIQFGDQRTTISVDNLLVGLLALKLGSQPDDTRVVRKWIQARLPEKIGADRGSVKKASQHARLLMIEAIAETKFLAAYDDWITSQKNF